MTYSQVETLLVLKAPKVDTSKYLFLQGVVPDEDNIFKIIEPTQQVRYFSVLLDVNKRKDIPLKDILTGKELDAVILRVQLDSIDKIKSYYSFVNINYSK